jgi:hypothetical protein
LTLLCRREPFLMKHHARILLLIPLFILVSCRTLSAQAWNFIKEKDGIKIYTRTEPNSSLKSFKGVMDVHSTMEKVSSLVGNVNNHDWWDENLKEIKVLQYIPDKRFEYYLVYNVPWPLWDRDLCVESTVSVDPVTGIKVIYAKPLPNLVPEKPDLVRIKNYWQKWTIEPMGNGIIHITLEGFVDPGGNVPSWLYNMVITDAPLKVMRGVKQRVIIN